MTCHKRPLHKAGGRTLLAAGLLIILAGAASAETFRMNRNWIDVLVSINRSSKNRVDLEVELEEDVPSHVHIERVVLISPKRKRYTAKDHAVPAVSSGVLPGNRPRYMKIVFKIDNENIEDERGKWKVAVKLKLRDARHISLVRAVDLSGEAIHPSIEDKTLSMWGPIRRDKYIRMEGPLGKSVHSDIAARNNRRGFFDKIFSHPPRPVFGANNRYNAHVTEYQPDKE